MKTNQTIRIETDLARKPLLKTENPRVGGSIPPLGTIVLRVQPGDMVYILYRRHGLHILRGEGILRRFHPVFIPIEKS
jgi:hypothetical protein